MWFCVILIPPRLSLHALWHSPFRLYFDSMLSLPFIMPSCLESPQPIQTWIVPPAALTMPSTLTYFIWNHDLTFASHRNILRSPVPQPISLRSCDKTTKSSKTQEIFAFYSRFYPVFTSLHSFITISTRTQPLLLIFELVHASPNLHTRFQTFSDIFISFTHFRDLPLILEPYDTFSTSWLIRNSFYLLFKPSTLVFYSLTRL